MNYAKKKQKKKNNIKGTTVALIIVAVLDVIFTTAMIWLFWLYQDVPDSLIVAVFGATFGECGFCTLIYKMKQGVKEDTGDGVHGPDILSEVKALRDSRYEE